VTKPVPVSLDERDRQGTVCLLDDEQAAALATTKLVEVTPECSGAWRLLPAGRVGAVRVGDLDVRVRPKTTIASLLFLLGYAADPGFRPEDVAGVPDEGLWPALGESLTRQAERALGPGVLQGYVTNDESLPLVRGRIRIADQIARRPGMLLPLEVRYDEYSPDVAENQLLRTGLRRMMTVPGLAPGLRTRLAHLDGRLDGVNVLTPGVPLPTWRVTRLNARYAAALRLAEIVLRHQSAEPGPGDVTIAAFVVSMAKVFEDFLTVALREALAPYLGSTEGQYPSYLDEDETIPIRPDVVHVRGGRPVAVFDAKYKLEDASSRYPNADLYQMLAYCTALGLPRGWLVYAQGTAPPRSRRVVNTSIDIVPYWFDLAVRPLDLLQQVRELAAKAVSQEQDRLRRPA
jgi:5-methylcytosine-specific restriction enzyme subunit McrC